MCLLNIASSRNIENCSAKQIPLGDTGYSKEINKSLLKKGIFGGKDISSEFPELGNCAVYCVTEIHTKEDIDRLAQAVAESLNEEEIK